VRLLETEWANWYCREQDWGFVFYKLGYMWRRKIRHPFHVLWTYWVKNFLNWVHKFHSFRLNVLRNVIKKLKVFFYCGGVHDKLQNKSNILTLELTNSKINVSSSLCNDWLQAGRSGDRIPVRVRYFAHVQTGPGAHPTSYTMGTGFRFPGVKRPGRGVDQLPPDWAEFK
jgi:hypothetical protein